MLKEWQRGKSGSMMDFSMQMGTARTGGRFGVLLVSFEPFIGRPDIRVE